MVTRRLLLKASIVAAATPAGADAGLSNEDDGGADDDQQLQFHLQEAARIMNKMFGGDFIVEQRPAHRVAMIVG